ncbi:hypothetical protein AB0J80_32785 [Actinoplanes sp. NPDC049548]|uniref:hypothetical protein n=1 Tax=Actinoplanes sp. NPDC049548 TaxID=3155152 RepID=UPI003415AE9B
MSYPQQPGSSPQPAELPYGAPASFGAPPQPGAPYAPPAQASYGEPAPAPYSGPVQPAGVTAGQAGQFAVVACRLCGSVPAAPAKFRGHQGFVIVMRFLSLDGPFCRDCGLGTFRAMTSRTLVQGWYGWASFIITPITVLLNLFRRGKVANLAAPQPNPFGPSRPPMDPGPRLLQRPMTIIGLAIPFALIILIAFLASQDS